MGSPHRGTADLADYHSGRGSGLDASIIVSIAGLVVLILLLVIGLTRDNSRNEEKHAEAVRKVIEERARQDGTAHPAPPESPGH